ncbi:hypothetical protein EV2_026108 [Malus domestica]
MVESHAILGSTLGLATLTSTVGVFGLAGPGAHLPSGLEAGSHAIIGSRLGMRPGSSVSNGGVGSRLGIGPQLSLWNLISSQEQSDDPSKIGIAFTTSTKRDSGWIIDSEATDHMTYDEFLFHHLTVPPKENVITANGEIAPVIGAGSIALTSSLSLHNTLHVPSLLNHLLSVGQVTEQLDCVVLMFPTFCLLQYIQTRTIIGRGTKRRGLYYVDDVVPGQVNQVSSDHNNKVKRIWLWHRRLGHVSFGYLRKLLPSLFNGISDSDFQC